MNRRAFLTLLGLVAAAPAAAGEALVAAASDLRLAMPELVAAYARSSGQRVEVSYGSSGQFFHQILQGGPYEVFFSADEDYALRLHREGKTVDAGALYAIGTLSLVTHRSFPVRAESAWRSVTAAIRGGRLARFALANPEDAPYGRAAKAVLEDRALWDLLEGKRAIGDNVAQAAQFVIQGGALAGLVATPLAKAQAGSFGGVVPVPVGPYSPLRQRVVVLRSAGPAAHAFVAFVLGPQGRAILSRHGYGLP